MDLDVYLSWSSPYCQWRLRGTVKSEFRSQVNGITLGGACCLHFCLCCPLEVSSDKCVYTQSINWMLNSYLGCVLYTHAMKSHTLKLLIFNIILVKISLEHKDNNQLKKIQCPNHCFALILVFHWKEVYKCLKINCFSSNID